MGIYPHLNIIDGSFCVVADGKQVQRPRLAHSRHGADGHRGRPDRRRRAGAAGEAARALRRQPVRREGRITFTKRAAVVEEPRFIHQIGPRTTMDYTRLTQNGTYEGWLEVEASASDQARPLLGHLRPFVGRPVGAMTASQSRRPRRNSPGCRGRPISTTASRSTTTPKPAASRGTRPA